MNFPERRQFSLGQFDSQDEAAQALWASIGFLGSRIDFDPPYSTMQFVQDDLGQQIVFYEHLVLVSAPDDEYVGEYRPQWANISSRPPEPLLHIRPEIRDLCQGEPDARAVEALRFYFPGDAEALLIGQTLNLWLGQPAFGPLLKLFFRAPRWPVVAFAVLEEATLSYELPEEGCFLEAFATEALQGNCFPHCARFPDDFPEALWPVHQPIPNAELGRKLGWEYQGIQPLFATQDFSRIWFDVWGRVTDPDDRAQLPVNFFWERADFD